MAGDYNKPLPIPAPESEPFWQGAREHRLLIQKCADCATAWHPPSTLCPSCGARDFAWIEASGKGHIFSFVTYHRLYHKAWEGELPYVVAVIELEEGPRLLSNIIGIDAADVVCDLPVEVVFDDVTHDATLPKFRPRRRLKGIQ